MASRDPRLCAAAADPLERATCEAALEHDGRLCVRLRGVSQQARCMRDAQRWHGILATGENASAGAGTPDTKPFVVTGKLHLEAADAGTTAGQVIPIDVDLSPDLVRGVIVVQQREGMGIVIGALREGGVDFVAPSPHTATRFAVKLLVASSPFSPPKGTMVGQTKSARVERADLLVPGRTPVSTSDGRSTLVSKIECSAFSRGSAVTIDVNGDLGATDLTWRLHAEATTFVRDVVRSTDLLENRGPQERGAALGGDAGMR